MNGNGCPLVNGRSRVELFQTGLLFVFQNCGKLRCAISAFPENLYCCNAMATQDDINQLEWERPENWSGRLCVYRSARDTRIWVPKRNPSLGRTLNFAAAWWSLL